MKKIFFIALFLSPFTGYPQCLDLDIIVLGDFSGSVQGSEEYVFNAFESFTSIASEEKNIRIGLILFNQDPHVVVDLSKDKAAISSAVGPLRDTHASGSTDIEAAIQLAAMVLLSEQNNSRKLIILISDGDITDGGDNIITIATARQLSILGIGMCGVLIKNISSRPEFMKELSGGCYVETDYGNLSSELKNLDVCL